MDVGDSQKTTALVQPTDCDMLDQDYVLVNIGVLKTYFKGRADRIFL